MVLDDGGRSCAFKHYKSDTLQILQALLLMGLSGV